MPSFSTVEMFKKIQTLEDDDTSDLEPAEAASFIRGIDAPLFIA